MNWKFFGVISLLFSVLLYFMSGSKVEAKEEKKESLKKEISIKKSENTTKYIPVKYVKISPDMFKGLEVSCSVLDNGVVLSGKAKDIKDVEEIIHKIDVEPLSFDIEVSLISVDVTDTNQSGLNIIVDSLKSADNQYSFSFDGSSNILSWSGGINELVANISLTNSDVKLEAKSNLTVVQGEKSIVVNGEKRAFITDTTTDGVSVQSSYEFVEIGVSLTVTVDQSSSKEFAVLNVVQTADTVTGSTKIQDSEVPIISQRKLETIVRSPCNKTVVVGGLRRENLDIVTSGIPVLRKLPLLKRVFEHKKEVKTTSELLVILRPVQGIRYHKDGPVLVKNTVNSSKKNQGINGAKNVKGINDANKIKGIIYANKNIMPNVK